MKLVSYINIIILYWYTISIPTSYLHLFGYKKLERYLYSILFRYLLINKLAYKKNESEFLFQR